MYKKLTFAAAVLGICSSAFAADTGTACNQGTAAAIATSTSAYVKTGFTPKCSTNTIVAYDQTGDAAFGVAAASVKGRTYFSGTTNGSSITADGTFTSAPSAQDVLGKASARRDASS